MVVKVGTAELAVQQLVEVKAVCGGLTVAEVLVGPQNAKQELKRRNESYG